MSINIAIVTGASGTIGSEAVRRFIAGGYTVIGVDNDSRGHFLGPEGSTDKVRRKLQDDCPGYIALNADIRHEIEMRCLFQKYGSDIKAIIHAASQSSSEASLREPLTDFSINATGSLVLLELTRLYSPKATFINCSTRKVYGLHPDALPLIEGDSRFELPTNHEFFVNGLNENLPVDQTIHTPFGVSKLSSDLLVTEYGKLLGLYTANFRLSSVVSPTVLGTNLHGFLNYLGQSIITGKSYTISGHKGKQIRDNLHVRDAAEAFWLFTQNPRAGETYNLGGGRPNSCSIQEGITLFEKVSGKKATTKYVDTQRHGDVRWWISDNRKFQSAYPTWKVSTSLNDMAAELCKSYG